jgi:hypothetical protein
LGISSVSAFSRRRTWNHRRHLVCQSKSHARTEDDLKAGRPQWHLFHLHTEPGRSWSGPVHVRMLIHPGAASGVQSRSGETHAAIPSPPLADITPEQAVCACFLSGRGIPPFPTRATQVSRRATLPANAQGEAPPAASSNASLRAGHSCDYCHRVLMRSTTAEFPQMILSPSLWETT